MSTRTPVRVARRPRDVKVYDFQRPTTLVREHHRILEMAFETFARQWGTQLTARVRVVSQATLTSVSMKTYDDYVSDMPDTTTMVVCEVEGIAPRAVIQFPHTDALTWIAHMLGAGGPIPEVDRKFTDVERVLIVTIMEETLSHMRHAMGRLLDVSMKIDSIQHNPQFTQAAPAAELMVVAEFELRVGERTGMSTIAIPSMVLMPRLGEANPAESAEHAGEKMRHHLSNALLDVAVRLTETTVSPQEFMNLKVGQVLTLPHHETRPLDVLVAGNVMAHGTVGTSGSRAAVRIVSTEEK